jgi:hypothetical protein
VILVHSKGDDLALSGSYLSSRKGIGEVENWNELSLVS